MITPEGDYLSNVQGPDLRPHFKHLHWRKMPHSMGHLVASDWSDKSVDDPMFGLYKNCGLWTRDEGAILYNWARMVDGDWLDIGAHTGWTTAHVAAASCDVDAVDPMLSTVGFQDRFESNMKHCWNFMNEYHGRTSNSFFEIAAAWALKGVVIDFNGVVIDGDHEPGKPLEDAQNAAKHLAETGVIIFHDGIGRPTREAVTWLMDQGFKGRLYWTPYLVFVCWRGDFTPVDHIPDARIDWTNHKLEMQKDFDFERLL